MSALGGIGLTVALFMSNQAFVDPQLQGQAKFAAVLSVSSAVVGWLLRCPCRSSQAVGGQESSGDALTGAIKVMPGSDDVELEPGSDWIDNMLVDEILQIMWIQRRYRARGSSFPLPPANSALANSSRASSKRASSKV
mmetsp:Transcript_112511/g.313000  ORF Transcript_112511/g.313000 Transcript_112511/m.313000 type:complete len:138 (+) Transcript_112511:21-434(+)